MRPAHPLRSPAVVGGWSHLESFDRFHLVI